MPLWFAGTGLMRPFGASLDCNTHTISTLMLVHDNVHSDVSGCSGCTSHIWLMNSCIYFLLDVPLGCSPVAFISSSDGVRNQSQTRMGFLVPLSSREDFHFLITKIICRHMSRETEKHLKTTGFLISSVRVIRVKHRP